jgi:hypothetical protein
MIRKAKSGFSRTDFECTLLHPEFSQLRRSYAAKVPEEDWFRLTEQALFALPDKSDSY